MLETVELVTGDPVVGSVIWLHGLGADGHDFEPIVPAVQLPDRPLRFVFPHAPVRPVTLNAGMEMRAWFDIVAIDRRTEQDAAGIRDSESEVLALIEREKERGVPAESIVLAGFSQGGAIALHTGLCHPEPLAGIIGLSTYLPLTDVLDADGLDANRLTPIFMAHGTLDPVVPMALGEETRGLLRARNYPIDWKTYEMDHAVCLEQVEDIRDWMSRTFAR